MKVLVTGSNGQVGTAVCELLAAEDNHEFLGLSRDDLDISNRNDVNNLVSTFNPDAIVNTAAFTNVDLCETEHEKAYAVNSLGVRNLVAAAGDVGAHLIHISTDFVFDGSSNRPYTEFDVPNPLSIYAKSKLGGDVEALRYDRSTVLRVAWVFGNESNDFFSWAINGIRNGEIKALISDQISTPTYSRDVSNVISFCLNHRLTGLLNVANMGETSRHEMGMKACEYLGLDVSISGIDADTLARPAKRPQYSSLDTSSLLNQTGIQMRSWIEAMQEHLKRINL